jgi:hypothetical protein
MLHDPAIGTVAQPPPTVFCNLGNTHSSHTISAICRRQARMV